MDDIRKQLVANTEGILKDIVTTIRRIRKELESPELTPEEFIELHYALILCEQHKREARRLLAPAKRNGIICCTQLTYEEIQPSLVDEVLTKEYCDALIKFEMR